MQCWKKIKVESGLPCASCALRTKETKCSCLAYEKENIPISLLKQDKFCIFYMPESGNLKNEANMFKIFCKKEVLGFIYFFCLQLICVGYLAWWADAYRKWYFLWLFGVFLLSVLSFCKTVWKFRYFYEGLYTEEQEKLQEEFQNPHLVYSLFMGELHLLPSCLVSRTMGNWQILFFHEIERMDIWAYSQAYGLIKNLRLYMNTLKRYEFAFFGRHKKESQYAMAWIYLHNPAIELDRGQKKQ